MRLLGQEERAALEEVPLHQLALGTTLGILSHTLRTITALFPVLFEPIAFPSEPMHTVFRALRIFAALLSIVSEPIAFLSAPIALLSAPTPPISHTLRILSTLIRHISETRPRLSKTHRSFFENRRIHASPSTFDLRTRAAATALPTWRLSPS